MMVEVTEAFAAVLAEAPNPLMAAGRIGLARPSGSGDLPAIAMGVRAAVKAQVRGQPEPLGAWFSGTLPIEVWAGSAASAVDLCRGIETRLHDRRTRFRERGFGTFRTLSVEPAEAIRAPQPSGSDFGAFRLRLEIAFAYQAPTFDEVTEGAPITRIDASLTAPVGEQIVIS